jgi:hypothetical protein
MPRPPKFAVLALCCAAGLAGCNRYMLFNQAGYEQSSFNDDADILFVVDNSGSMAEETAALATNFGEFLSVLTSEEGAAQVTETLTDAVGNYITYTQDRGRFLDYRLAITTATAGDEGNDGILLPGEGGRFVGDSFSVVTKDDPDVEASFLELLICETGYWDNPPISGETVTDCETIPEDGQIDQEFLNCFCGGPEGWDNPAGTGQEEQLEAALMAMCRAADDPPELCSDATSVYAGTEGQTNPDFLRPGSTVVIVIVSDEGDLSRRIPGAETEATPYLEAFAEFDHPVKIVTIGPNFDMETGNVPCGSLGVGAPALYSVERLYDASVGSGGFYSFINTPSAEGEECDVNNFADPLRELGALLVNLDTAFELQSVPDVSTIQVWIDGEEVPQASLVSGEAGTPEAEYDSGWSYDPSQNAVSFWGKWIPDFNADVEIFYRPLEGQPRELPF